MAIQEHQNGEEKQLTSQDVAEPAQLVDKSRRNFSKSGLVASGVLLTLASRPVLAGKGSRGAIGGWACQSPSGFISGNVSSHGTPPLCMGRTHGYWKTLRAWDGEGLTPGTCTGGVADWSTKGASMFSGSFSCSGNGKIYKDLSLMQVMWMANGDDPAKLGANIVAALLNAKMGWTPVLSEAQVKGIFNEWDQFNFFTPTASVQWNNVQIVQYLNSTMDTRLTP